MKSSTVDFVQAVKPITENSMTNKKALEEIADIVSRWEYGGRMSGEAMNDVYLVLRQLKEEREQKKN